MALTLFEAAKQSRNPLTAGMLLAIATCDEMISQVPFVRKGGDSWVYTRENTLPGAEFVSPTHTSLTESGATGDQVTVPMRMIVSDVDTYIFTEEQQSDLISARSQQLEKKLKAAGRTISAKMITGSYATSTTLSPAMVGVSAPAMGVLSDSDRLGPGELFYDQAGEQMKYRAPGDRTFGPFVSTAGDPGALTLVSDNPSKTLSITVASTIALPAADQTSSVTVASTTNEPDGLLSLVTTGQTIASAGANGDAMSYAILDEAIDAVKTENRKFLVMNAALRRKYFELVRGLGGSDPMHIALPGITGQVPTYRGIPILRNDNIPSNETKGTGTTLSSVFCIDLSHDEGFYVGAGGQGSADSDLSPMETRILGLTARNLGELEDKEAVRTRVSWYGAFGLGSNLAVSRVSELVTE